MHGFRFEGCGEGYDYADSFEAVAPSGQRVSGVVCGGPVVDDKIRVDDPQVADKTRQALY